MNMKTNETRTKKKIVRYTAGAAILFILLSFIYQWKNGLQIDSTENFGLTLAVIIFASSLFPERTKESK